jgi:NTE family protein
VSDNKSKSVALVLGSGGARGLAHVGVAQVLIERGYNIVSMSGCSMGALVGAFIAADKLAIFEKWVCSLSYVDMLRLVDASFLANGNIKGDKFFNIISDLLGVENIEDLAMPYTAVAVDLVSQKEVWFQSGDLELALRSTVAIPSLLSPVVRGNRVLVDGGVLNPLPIAPSVSAHADHIIAVDLSADVPMPIVAKSDDTSVEINQPEVLMNRRKGDKKIDPEITEVSETAEVPTENSNESWIDALKDKAEKWLSFSGDTDVEDKKSEPETIIAGLGKIGIMNEVFETMQTSLTQYKIAGYPPDLLIQVPNNCAKIYEFYRAEELIALGRVVAEQAIDKYEM